MSNLWGELYHDWHIEFLKDSITTSELSKVDSYILKVPYTVKKLNNNAKKVSLYVASLYLLEAKENEDYSIVTRKITLDPSTLDAGTTRQASIRITIQTDNHIEKEEKQLLGLRLVTLIKLRVT